MQRVSVIIPAFNEAMIIKNTLAKVFDYFEKNTELAEVIVVDDGSSDATAAIVSDEEKRYPKLRLLVNDINRGKGYSVRRGAHEASGDWVLFLDADLSTRPEEFEKFKPHLNSADIVIGSRDVRGSQILKQQPLFRRLSSKLLKQVIKFSIGLQYADTQCGFKCFNRRSLVVFNEQKTRRWMFDLELLALARKQGFQVVEVPVNWTNDESSTVRTKDIFNILKELMIIRKI